MEARCFAEILVASQAENLPIILTFGVCSANFMEKRKLLQMMQWQEK